MMLLCVSWISFEQRKSSDTNYTLYVCDYCVVRHVIWSATLHWWSSTNLKQHYCCLQLHIWLISIIYMNSPLAGLIRCSPTPFKISLLPLSPIPFPLPLPPSSSPPPSKNVEKNVPQLFFSGVVIVLSWLSAISTGFTIFKPPRREGRDRSFHFWWARHLAS